MAARLWLCALLAAIGIGAATAWLLAGLGSLPLAAAIAIAFLLVGALPWLLAVAASIAARVLQSRAPVSPIDEARPIRESRGIGTAWLAARAVLTEGAAMWRIVLAMSTAPARRSLRCRSRTPERLRPVLLIHGVLCNGAVWRPLAARLREAGFGPLHALDLEPLATSIERYADQVARELLVLHEQSGGERVAVIAHSLGGLVARAALRTLGASAFGPLITVATPHHGTAMARWVGLESMRQIRPESPWLAALNGSRSAAAAPEMSAMTSLYSLDDELVVPAGSAALEGAHNIGLAGVGHLGLLSSPRAIGHILLALESR